MKIVSLFAGCGGLDLGFEQAGFDIVWANEFDSSIHATYAYNHPNTQLNTSDIRNLKSCDIPDCDGIIGGPPCQSWSEGGKQLGIEDSRGQLFWDYIRIVGEKKPKFFVIENVKGLLEDKHKQSLNDFLSALTQTGYRVKYELLNAVDYRIPQDRYRVFFVGIRHDLPNRFEFPNAVSTTPITLRQAIGDIVEAPRCYGDDPVEGDNPIRLNHDTYTGSYDSKYMARNRVRSWDEPSFTMQAQARNTPQHPQAPKMVFVSSQQRTFAKGYEKLYRRLSVRECARIQTFPDKFRFIYSDIKDGYKMVGNAVPPRLAWYIAIQIKKTFGDEMLLSSIEKKAITLTPTKQITVQSIAKDYPRTIIENKEISMIESSSLLTDDTYVDFDKRVLISLVKDDTAEIYYNHSPKIYYTGSKFPSTVALNKLYYFMPYIKGRGIKDLYFIKIARVGNKAEVHPECGDNDFRLVFELQFVKQLFTDYQPIHLNIWHTFTDTTLNRIVKIEDNEET